MTKSNNIVVNLPSGEVLYLCSLANEIKRKKAMDNIIKEGQYIYKNKYHIPALTINLIVNNTRGVVLSTILCPHCKKTIVMTLQSILREEITICCNCHKNLYSNNKPQGRKMVIA